MTRVRIALEPARGRRWPSLKDAPAPGSRRICDVDVNALLLVVPLVLGRDGMRTLLEHHGLSASGSAATLACDLVARCQRPCSLADEVEHALDARTAHLRQATASYPAEVLSAWWADANDDDWPALLWCIASDPRYDLDAARFARSGRDDASARRVASRETTPTHSP